MKYFVMLDECKNTCYHEFYKGEWDEETFWKNDSLYLHDDFLFDLKLEDLFYEVNSSYDPFGEVEMDKKHWQQICENARSVGGEALEAIEELNEWVSEAFKDYEVFTILGI